jgi:hypothetical protein
MVAASIFNMQSRTADKVWSSSLKIGRFAKNHHCKNWTCYETDICHGPGPTIRRRWEYNIKMDLQDVGLGEHGLNRYGLG